MPAKRVQPQTLAVENVVFVDFPTSRNSREYFEQLAAEGRQAIQTLRATIECTRLLARRAQSLATPGAGRSELLEEAVAAEARRLDTSESFQAHRQA